MAKMGMTFSYWYLTEFNKLTRQGYSPGEAGVKVWEYVDKYDLLKSNEWKPEPDVSSGDDNVVVDNDSQ